MEISKISYSYSWLIFSNKEKIELGMHHSTKIIEVSRNLFNCEEHSLGVVENDLEDGIIAILKEEELTYYLHVRNREIYLTPYINGYTARSIDLNIVEKSTRFKISKTAYSYQLTDTASGESFVLDEKIFMDGRNKIDLPMHYIEGDPYVYLSITYNNFSTFLEYTIKKESFSLKTVSYKLFRNKELNIKFLSANLFILQYGKIKQRLKISEIVKEKQVEISDGFLELLEKPIFIKIAKRIYVLSKGEDHKAYILYDLRSPLLLNEATYSFKQTNKGLQIKGTIDFKYQVPANTIVNNRGLELAKVNWQNDQQFIATIPNEKLKQFTDLHTGLKLAYNHEIIFTMNRYTETISKKKILKTFELDGKVYVVRLSLKKDYVITSLPTLPMYSKANKLKIKLAEITAKVYKGFFKKNINLYFEKDASRALESSIYVFNYVQKDPSIKTINKFILDARSPQYRALKQQYKKDLIKRFSFKNYLYIYLADYFVASELSNHVLAVRVYNESLAKKITSTPLYFLQHGIMFAKPVDNPMALGFHKAHLVNNVIKNVISSDLEAGEFYKMGYDDNDLMKTGLPKLDGAALNNDADKIAYMPTWRYWEESYILNDEIEKTTYYDSLQQIIKLFEKEGLLDRLLIVPHNKFSDYVYDNMKEYSHIICKDPTEALKISTIFITDYSSIIYDAAYRGAYPIFYWADAEYLIEKYKAIPPVNEENAPGIIAKSPEELVAAVKIAIENNYKIPEDIIMKYRKINEFADNQNTARVVKILKNDGVL